MLDVVSRYLDFDWGQVHYRTVPTGADTPLLVFLHQTPLSSRRYAPVLPLLSEVGRPVALDTPGYGNSDAPPMEWELAGYADTVWRVVDRLGDGEVVFIGQHTGAAIAVEAALQRPGAVVGIVLHGLALYSEEERTARLSSYAPALPELPRPRLNAIADRAVRLYPHLKREEVALMTHEYLEAEPDYARAYRAVFRYDVAAALTRLRAPVMSLVGERDLVAWMTPRLRSIVDPVAEISIEDATDFAPEERPDVFADAVAGFVRQLSCR
jgi:haloalkane dehalogenase